MYALEIADLSAQNEALKAKTSQLETDNLKLAQEWEHVLEMLVEAKQIIEMAEVRALRNALNCDACYK